MKKKTEKIAGGMKGKNVDKQKGDTYLCSISNNEAHPPQAEGRSLIGSWQKGGRWLGGCKIMTPLLHT